MEHTCVTNTVEVGARGLQAQGQRMRVQQAVPLASSEDIDHEGMTRMCVQGIQETPVSKKRASAGFSQTPPPHLPFWLKRTNGKRTCFPQQQCVHQHGGQEESGGIHKEVSKALPLKCKG